MTSLLRGILCLILLAALAGCASYDPVWRTRAQVMVLQLQQEDAAVIFPEEYASVDRTYRQGESLLTKELEARLADEQFKLAYQKGMVLRQEVFVHREHLREEARLKQIEERAQREEEIRARREVELKRQEELREAQKNLQGKPEPTVLPEIHEERRVELVSSYTVRRGETLPQIAARPELYNDVALWPLIYRANRDQIRDPYQLWPGQILRIPRNFSREEALEARRQAHRRR